MKIEDITVIVTTFKSDKKIDLCFPLSVWAIRVATRPNVLPSASTIHQALRQVPL